MSYYLCVLNDSPGLTLPTSAHLLAATRQHRHNPNTNQATGNVAKISRHGPPNGAACAVHKVGYHIYTNMYTYKTRDGRREGWGQ